MLDLSDPRQARIAERLQHEEFAYLTTVRPDGRPHSVPVCYVWEGETILIFCVPDSVKIRNLRQNPRVTLALDNFGHSDYFAVVVEGAVALVDEPGLDMTEPAYAAKYTALSQRLFGTNLPPTDFMRKFSQAIRITPTKIRNDE